MVATDLLLYKFILTSIIVIALSFVAEYISPKWAGIFSGFPTGTAIILYFYALENGLEFAGESAIYNMVGLVAMQMFIFCYYLSGLVAKKFKIILSISGGITGYTVTIILLSRFAFTPALAVITPLISIFIFRMLFQKIDHSEINVKIKPTWKVILGRAGLAALTISLITGIAELVGPTWAGLFSAFPTTLFPLLLIIHFSYGERYAHSIIKHVPDGLVGLLIYSLTIYLSYPQFGIYLGIILAFSGALIYLLIYQLVTLKLRTLIRKNNITIR
jgi:hypothetical protein